MTLLGASMCINKVLVRTLFQQAQLVQWIVLLLFTWTSWVQFPACTMKLFQNYKFPFQVRIALALRFKVDCRGRGDGNGGQFCKACSQALKRLRKVLRMVAQPLLSSAIQVIEFGEATQIFFKYSNPSLTRGSKLAKFSNSRFQLFSSCNPPKLTF